METLPLLTRIFVADQKVLLEPLSNKTPVDQVTIKPFLTHRIGFNKEALAGQVNMIFEGRDEKAPELLYFSVNVIFEFQIPELSTMPESDGVVEVPEHILLSLLSVGISTGRGIVWERLLGTPYQNYILPLFDPVKVLKGI